MSKIRATIKPVREIYYSDGYGIYACAPLEYKEDELKLDYKEQITVKGSMQQLVINLPYHAILKEVEDDKHGVQYENLCIYIPLGKDDDYSKRQVLEELFTEKQVESMYNALDDPYSALINADYVSLIKIKGCGFNNAVMWSERVQDNVIIGRLMAQLSELDLTFAMYKKILGYYNSPDLAVQEIYKNPYNLCNIDGIGWRKADAVALKMGIGEWSKERIGGYIKYYLDAMGIGGSSYLFADELMEGICAGLGEDCPSLAISDAIHSIDDVLWYSEDHEKIGLKKYYELEEKIGKELLRLRDADSTVNSKKNWETVIKNMEEQQGWEFTDEQITGVRTALDNNVIVINGLAGCGKSSMVSAILHALDVAEYDIGVCALSGKASARVGELANIEGKTIHRLLGYPAFGGSGKNNFTYHDENPLIQSVIVLDEISMVGGEIFYYLLRAISSGSKLILVGDTGQLESIGIGKVAYDIIDSGEIPVVTLTKIHRQAQKSAIITESIRIHNGSYIIPKEWTGTETRGELQDLTLDVYSDKSNTAYKMIEQFKKALSEDGLGIMDVQMIVPTKKRGGASTYALNNMAQEYYNPPLKSKKELKVRMRDGSPLIIREGDKILNTRNNYKTIDTNTGEISPIFNGNLGVVLKVNTNAKTIIVDFGDARVVELGTNILPYIELGYAITVHKYQGSQAHTIIVGIDYSAFSMLSRELLYTAITRASKKCYLCAQNAALRYGISQIKTSEKHTFLCDILKDLAHPKIVF